MPDVKWIGSPNYYAQSGVKKLFITDHWMVGTLGSTDTVFKSSARKASATYGVGETEIHQYVNEKDYPFSDGNTYANQHTISIEHEGGYLLPDGTRKKPSPAVHELSAQLHADIARRHGFGKLVLGVNVFPHNHWVATACPGSLDIQWIVDRANQINGQGGAPIGGVNGGSTAALGFNATTVSTKAIQQALIAAGYDLGPTGADGVYGAYTTKAVHQLEVDRGLSVDVGIAGPQVIQSLGLVGGTKPAGGGVAAPPFPLPAGSYFGPKSGPRQSVSGYFSHREDLRRWQQRMKDRGWIITVDGLYGDETGDTAEAFQREKGLRVDREIGPQTWSAAWTAPIT